MVTILLFTIVIVVHMVFKHIFAVYRTYVFHAINILAYMNTVILTLLAL